MKKLFFFLACLLATVSFSSQFQLDSLKNQYQINDALYIEKDRSIKLLSKELDSLIGQNKELLKSLEKSKLELEIAKSEYQTRNDWINKVIKSKKNEISLLQNEVDSSFIILANYFEDDLGIYLYNSLKSKNISVIKSSNAKKTSNYLKNQMKSNLQLLDKNLDLVDKVYKFIITDDNIIGYRPDINFNKLKILRIDTLPISSISNQKFLKYVKKHDPFVSFNTLSFLKESTGLDSNYFKIKEKRKFNVREIEQLKYDIEKLKTKNNDLLNDYLEKTSPITQKIKSLEYKIETIRNRSGSLHLSLKSDSSITKDVAHNLKLIQKLIPKEKKLYENYLIKNKKKYYYDNNQLKSVGCKIINTPIGYWKYYHLNGELQSKGNYNSKGTKIGKWYYYFNDGKLSKIEQFDNEGRLDKIGKWTNYFSGQKIYSKNIEIYFQEPNNGSEIIVYRKNKIFLKAEHIHQNDPLSHDDLYTKEINSFSSGIGGLLWNLQDASEYDFSQWVGGYYGYEKIQLVQSSNIQSIFHGKCVQYDLNGRKHSEFTIESNNTYPNNVIFNKNDDVSYYSFCGSYSSYYPNGRVKEKGHYISNLKVGNWKTYHENGRLSSTGNYSIVRNFKDSYYSGKFKSVESGKWEYYNKYGKLMDETIFKEYPDAVFNELKKKILKDNSTNKAHKSPTKSLVINTKDIEQKKINSLKEEKKDSSENSKSKSEILLDIEKLKKQFVNFDEKTNRLFELMEGSIKLVQSDKETKTLKFLLKQINKYFTSINQAKLISSISMKCFISDDKIVMIYFEPQKKVIENIHVIERKNIDQKKYNKFILVHYPFYASNPHELLVFFNLNDKYFDYNYMYQVFAYEKNILNDNFNVVDPHPAGGMSKLYEFLGKNIQYPEMAKENGIQGKVFVQFVIWNDGTIKDVKVIKGIHKTLDNEAKRVIEIMPKWIPAIQNGKFVNSKFTLPITFRIS